MQSLNCRKPNEILLLLKSSYLASADKEKAENLGFPLRLNLSKYHKLRKSMIFRVFVKNRNLIAACQKETSSFYEFLQEIQEKIIEKVEDIFEEVIAVCPLDSFSFDIYIDLPPQQRVFILGFNPFLEPTDPLLFTWEELNALENFQFRIVLEDKIKPSELSSFRVPVEIATGQDISEFLDSLKSK
jgi:hypothetical protein